MANADACKISRKPPVLFAVRPEVKPRVGNQNVYELYEFNTKDNKHTIVPKMPYGDEIPELLNSLRLSKKHNKVLCTPRECAGTSTSVYSFKATDGNALLQVTDTSSLLDYKTPGGMETSNQLPADWSMIDKTPLSKRTIVGASPRVNPMLGDTNTSDNTLNNPLLIESNLPMLRRGNKVNSETLPEVSNFRCQS